MKMDFTKMAKSFERMAKERGLFVGWWVPVSEGLPKKNGYYLTTTMYYEVYCDYWKEDSFNRTEAVIAWMPLPAPFELRENKM